MIKCAKCKVLKDEDKFYKNSLKVNGKQEYCIESVLRL